MLVLEHLIDADRDVGHVRRRTRKERGGGLASRPSLADERLVIGDGGRGSEEGGIVRQDKESPHVRRNPASFRAES
jgi:hypothetical protein